MKKRLALHHEPAKPRAVVKRPTKRRRPLVVRHESFGERVARETDWLILDARPIADFVVIWNAVAVVVRLGRRRWPYDTQRVERTGTPIATSFEDVHAALVGGDDREKIAKRRVVVRDTELDGFTPTVVDARHGTMLVELERCKYCRAKIVRWRGDRHDGPFPNWIALNFEAQLKRAGWRTGQHTTDGNDWICEACDAAGKESFTCVLCELERPTSAVQDRVGDPPDFLCTACYATRPAREYGDKLAELEASHRYD